MKNRRFLAALLALMLVLTLVTPVMAAESTGGRLKIAALSDLHYMSPDLIADTADYTHALNMDRKMLTQADAIDELLFDAVRKDKPDVLLISGDLTKDGEQENHRAVSEKLQQLKKDMPDLKIYLINGNHDIRNANGQIFSTPDGVAVPATRTNPQDFREIYDFIYSDETVIATYTPPEGKEAGSLSYVARPCEGYTVIAIDSCRYSADNRDKAEDEHETSGAVSAELVQWVTEQITTAKQRGDIVIGLEHHGLVPHFTMEPVVMPMYLIEDYGSIAAKWTDAGMDMVFTGHMHALDIAAMTTAAGNTLYDIETGSTVSYPSPMRTVDISRNYRGDTVVDVKSGTHFGPISYTEADGTPGYIEDITVYGKTQGLSEDMLCTVAGTFLGQFLVGITGDSELALWVADKICAEVENIVSDLVNIKVAGDKTLLEVANYLYQSHLAGLDDGIYPDWVNEGLANVKNGQVLDSILNVIKQHAFGTYADRVKFDNLFTRFVKNEINGLILKIADSFGNDKNYTDDIDTVIVLPAENPKLLPFADVPVTHWAYDDIGYVYDNGIYKGTGENTFSPETVMTRGMLVTVLWRMEGEPDAEESSFADAQNIWCSEAIDWAAEQGIVKGCDENCFAPDGIVTREQIAAILFRYAAYKGGDVSARADTAHFADSATVSAYALDAVSWAVSEKILRGGDGMLLPGEGATRAQVAAILHRYIEG